MKKIMHTTDKNLFIFIGVFLIAWGFNVTRTTPEISEKPIETIVSKFQVGDCFTLKPENDEWGINRSVVRIIVDVGQHSYKTSFVDTIEHCVNNSANCIILNFSEQNFYTKSSCNP